MLLRERALRAQRANNACRIPYTQNRGKMGNIRPCGRPKGRNHVGIYLFETISEQVESREPERHRHVTTIANSTMRHLPLAAWRGVIARQPIRQPSAQTALGGAGRSCSTAPQTSSSPASAKPPPSLHPRISECVAERLARKQRHLSPYMPPVLGRTAHDLRQETAALKDKRPPTDVDDLLMIP